MGNIYGCDLKVVGNRKASEVVVKTLNELAMYGEHKTYRLKDGLLSHFVIKNGVRSYLFKRDDEYNFLELSKKYKFNFEIYCEKEEDDEYEYYLVKEGEIRKKDIKEYHLFHEGEDLDSFLAFSI